MRSALVGITIGILACLFFIARQTHGLGQACASTSDCSANEVCSSSSCACGAGYYAASSACTPVPGGYYPTADISGAVQSPTNYWYMTAMDSDGVNQAAVGYGDYNTGQGIYLSIDSGSTWAASSGAGTSSWVCIDMSSDGSTLIAGQGTAGDVMISTNAGATWSTASIGSTDDWYGVALSSDGTSMAAAAFSGTLYTSSNSGGSWSSAYSVSEAFYDVAVSSDFTTVVVVGYNVYIATGGSLSFSNAGASAGHYRRVDCDSDCSTIIASRFGSSLIVVSTDSGSSWSEINDAVVSTGNWWGVSSSSDGTKLTVVENGGGVFTSADSGSNWVHENIQNRSYTDVSVIDDGSKLVLSVYNGQLYHSGNSGDYWTTYAPGLFSSGNAVATAALGYVACAAGTYSSSGSTSCTTCAAGKFAASAGLSACADCPTGFDADAGSSACTACSSDVGIVETGTGACACDYGYKFIGSALNCTQCSAGTITESLGSANCTLCSAGFDSNANRTNCSVPCAAGTFNDGTSGLGCVACPAGKYQEATGASACILLTPGSYSPNGVDEKDCPSDSYIPEGDTSQCLPCDFPYHTNCDLLVDEDGGEYQECTACSVVNFNTDPGEVAGFMLVMVLMIAGSLYYHRDAAGDFFWKQSLLFMLFLGMPLLNHFMEVLYITTCTFANRALLALSFLCWLVPLLAFGRVLHERKAVARPILPVPQLEQDDILKIILQFILYIPDMIILFPLLVVGMFLFSTGMMAIGRVNNNWFHLWTGNDNHATAAVIDPKMLNEIIYVLCLYEALPMFWLHIISNSEYNPKVVEWSHVKPANIACFLTSFFAMMIGVYRVAYWRIFQQMDMKEIPVNFTLPFLGTLRTFGSAEDDDKTLTGIMGEEANSPMQTHSRDLGAENIPSWGEDAIPANPKGGMFSRIFGGGKTDAAGAEDGISEHSSDLRRSLI